MSYKKMPPQAYTKETLQEAFEWWSEQPEDFRSKVQSNDDLIGYYLKVRRGVESPSPQEVESMAAAAKETFSSELKDLAKGLDAFEGYRGGRRGSSLKAVKKEETSVEVVHQQERGASVAVPKKSVFEPSFQLQFPEMARALDPEEEKPSSKKPSVRTKYVVPRVKPKPPARTPSYKAPDVEKERYFKLDAKSHRVVQQAQEILNLSSEEEALRAVISMGASKLKALA